MTEDGPEGIPEDGSFDEGVVRREIEKITGFVRDLSMDDLRQGTWFVKLLAFSLDKYTTDIDAHYFRHKYPNLPVDAVVQARIQMAANHASIEGGISAAAYSGLVAATIGSRGGASPLTLPAGGASFVIDLAYTSQLQMRMAHDIAVLYSIPLDLNDPDDIWKLVKIAFAVKTGEVGRGAVLKGVPAVIRPVVKKIFSGSNLAAVKSLPVVGKYLLQRNIIKFAIPLVGVPLPIGANFWTTRVAGAQAQRILRREAKIIEAASRVAHSTHHHEALLWVLWLMMQTSGTASESQRTLLHHVIAHVSDAGDYQGVLDELRSVVEVDEEDVWSMLAAIEGDRHPIYKAAVLAVAVNGKVSNEELTQLEKVAEICVVDYDQGDVRNKAHSWS